MSGGRDGELEVLEVSFCTTDRPLLSLARFVDVLKLLHIVSATSVVNTLICNVPALMLVLYSRQTNRHQDVIRAGESIETKPGPSLYISKKNNNKTTPKKICQYFFKLFEQQYLSSARYLLSFSALQSCFNIFF